MLLKAKTDKEPNMLMDHPNLLKQSEHQNPQNLYTFTVQDLDLLILMATYNLTYKAQSE